MKQAISATQVATHLARRQREHDQFRRQILEVLRALDRERERRRSRRQELHRDSNAA